MVKIWYILFLVHTIWYPSSYCDTELMEEKLEESHADTKVFRNLFNHWWKIIHSVSYNSTSFKSDAPDSTSAALEFTSAVLESTPAALEFTSLAPGFKYQRWVLHIQLEFIDENSFISVKPAGLHGQTPLDASHKHISVRFASQMIFRLLGEKPRNQYIRTLFKQANIIEHLLSTMQERSENGKLLTLEQIERLIARQIKDFCKPEKIDCDEQAEYRTADGTCNNLQKKHMGAADTAFARFLPAEYGDRFNWGSTPKIKGQSGKKLKSPRIISNKVFKSDTPSPKSEKITMFGVNFGQFLDHDITLTPVLTEVGGSPIECCDGDKAIKRSECASFKTPPGDFLNTCMGFVRSRPACEYGVREQMNGITSWIDASNVYGSDQEVQDSLRAEDGKLRVSENGLLPDDTSDCGETSKCFYAGDVRNSEVGPLTTIHTTFVREHNRIAEKLKSIKGWDAEKIFQETRKVIIAMMQHIVYNEFLPPLLGNEYAKSNGLTSSPAGLVNNYNSSADGRICNSFATAAYRFGHSMVENKVGYSNSDFHEDEDHAATLQESFFRTKFVREEVNYGVQNMGRWMSATCGKKMDRFFGQQLLNHLFEHEPKTGLDLAALNIQRGRDHGLPGYNKFREYCGLKPATKFKNTVDGFVHHTEDAVRKLKMVYSSPDDVELFVGSISEEPESEDTILGPTFRCLIKEQFYRLKYADRFFYENSNPKPWFTEEQVNEIKAQSMAGIACRALNIDSMQRNIFLKPNGERVPCGSLPDLDFDKF